MNYNEKYQTSKELKNLAVEMVKAIDEVVKNEVVRLTGEE